MGVYLTWLESIELLCRIVSFVDERSLSEYSKTSVINKCIERYSTKPYHEKATEKIFGRRHDGSNAPLNRAHVLYDFLTAIRYKKPFEFSDTDYEVIKNKLGRKMLEKSDLYSLKEYRLSSKMEQFRNTIWWLYFSYPHFVQKKQGKSKVTVISKGLVRFEDFGKLSIDIYIPKLKAFKTYTGNYEILENSETKLYLTFFHEGNTSVLSTGIFYVGDNKIDLSVGTMDDLEITYKVRPTILERIKQSVEKTAVAGWYSSAIDTMHNENVRSSIWHYFQRIDEFDFLEMHNINSVKLFDVFISNYMKPMLYEEAVSFQYFFGVDLSSEDELRRRWMEHGLSETMSFLIFKGTRESLLNTLYSIDDKKQIKR